MQNRLEWIYADCGKQNRKAFIQIRRLMYLWHVLSRDENELISRVYSAQTNCNNTGDWVRLVQADNDKEMQGVSKNVFKSVVKKSATIAHLKYLDGLKKKHLKLKFLDCTKLKQADYIQIKLLPLGKKVYYSN